MKQKAVRKVKGKAKPKPVPPGFHTLTPYLVIRDASKAIEFYKQAFGAKVREVHYTPDGKVMNASLKIGDSIVMMSDEFPFGPCKSPQSLGSTTIIVHIYVKDVDKLYNQAVAAGAKVAMPLMDAFWGDRYGQLEDPFGHRWSLAAHNRDLTPKQIEEGGKAAMAEMAKQAQPGS
jgi:PhnB protein